MLSLCRSISTLVYIDHDPSVDYPPTLHLATMRAFTTTAVAILAFASSTFAGRYIVNNRCLESKW